MYNNNNNNNNNNFIETKLQDAIGKIIKYRLVNKLAIVIW